LSTLLSALHLTQYTHFEPTTFLSGGHGTVIHVPAFSSVVSSQSIASFQRGQLEQDRASEYDFGSVSTLRIAPVIRLSNLGSNTHWTVSISVPSSVPSPAAMRCKYCNGFFTCVDLHVGCKACAVFRLHFFFMGMSGEVSSCLTSSSSSSSSSSLCGAEDRGVRGDGGSRMDVGKGPASASTGGAGAGIGGACAGTGAGSGATAPGGVPVGT